MNLESFAVFGFNSKINYVQDCIINITINFSTVNSALICISCDVQIDNSTLIFIANGTFVSGIMQEAQNTIIIVNTNISYRFSSQQSAGIVNRIVNPIQKSSIDKTKLSGFNYVQSQYNGFISSYVNVSTTITLISFITCVDSLIVGQNSITLTVVGTVNAACNLVCQNHYVYGLCLDNLQNGEIVNDKYICKFPFEFNSQTCQCAFGYIFNSTNCVNVLNQIYLLNQELDSKISIIDAKIDTEKQFMLTQLQNNFSQLSSWLQGNNTQLQTRIQSNYTQQYNNLQSNYTSLENLIKSQFVNQQNILINNVTQLSQYIALNNSLLQNYIKGNFTQISQTIQANNILVEQSIINNVTSLNSLIAYNFGLTNSYISGNYSKADASLTTAQQTINTNINNVQNQIQAKITNNQASADSKVSTIQASMNTRISELLTTINTIYLPRVEYKC
ncbi:Hypothetical_protein [Hexamita inflata]|uniref:Hypothetical_protein n=1 Tax=Hexamita inflata TaxID=28002 RepID=A0AA86R083_9EUKA|nr:Hypothetical protein HINF_LOCUS54853 [Hexamita inflata]